MMARIPEKPAIGVHVVNYPNAGRPLGLMPSFADITCLYPAPAILCCHVPSSPHFTPLINWLATVTYFTCTKKSSR